MLDVRRPPTRLIIVALALSALAWEGVDVRAQATNPLFATTKDQGGIALRTRLALPSTQRALELLTNTTDPDSLAMAVESLNNSYRYLRAAQEGTDLLIRIAKYPDPLQSIRRDQMWDVRVHLLQCLDIRGHVIPGNNDAIATCTDNVTTALSKLETLLLIMP